VKLLSEHQVKILKGIAHPVRVAIVKMLANKELCACEIAEQFSSDRTTVSKHLALMRDLGIIEDRRDGQNIFYSLKMRCLLTVLECIDNVKNVKGGCAL
jgi:ArsR family transcriptional regulator